MARTRGIAVVLILGGLAVNPAAAAPRTESCIVDSLPTASCSHTFIATDPILSVGYEVGPLATGMMRGSITSDGEAFANIMCVTPAYCELSLVGENEIHPGQEVVITLDAIGVGHWEVFAEYEETPPTSP